MTPEEVRHIIREELQAFMKLDRFTFSKNIDIADGRNISLSNGAGTKLGTTATQKLGFYGVTPVIQPTAIAQTTGGTTIDVNVRATVDLIRARLTALGLTA